MSRKQKTSFLKIKI